MEKEFRKYCGLNENKITTYESLCNLEETGWVLQQMRLEQLNIYNQNKEFFACLTLYAKIDSKWTVDLNV